MRWITQTIEVGKFTARLSGEGRSKSEFTSRVNMWDQNPREKRRKKLPSYAGGGGKEYKPDRP